MSFHVVKNSSRCLREYIDFLYLRGYNIFNYGMKRGIYMYRDKTKIIQIGDRVIGGGNPILIQSMTNVPAKNVEATVEVLTSFFFFILK